MLTVTHYFRKLDAMIANQLILTAFLALGVTACCVADKKITPVETTDRRDVIVEEAPLGLSVIEPTSDVAKLTKAVRHVLFPDASLASVSVERATPIPRKEHPTVPPIAETTISRSSDRSSLGIIFAYKVFSLA